MIIQLDDLDPCTVELFQPVPLPAARLLDSLPRLDVKFVPSCWSGPVCEVDISSLGIDLNGVSVFARTCSLYPGMVSLRVDRAVLEISYGAGESRSVIGVQYGLTIGRVVHTGGGLGDAVVDGPKHASRPRGRAGIFGGSRRHP